MDGRQQKQQLINVTISNKKTFKPIVLFDSSQPESNTYTNQLDSRSNSQDQQPDASECWHKIREMLNHNVKLWENERSLQHTSVSVNERESRSQSVEEQHIHSNRNPLSYTSSNTNYKPLHMYPPVSVSGDNNLMLESQIRTPIPSGLHSRNPSSSLANNGVASNWFTKHDTNELGQLSIVKGSVSTEMETRYDTDDDDDEEQITESTKTMFINEPQSHHDYKPNIKQKRKRGNLPKEVTELLKKWLILHKKHPYPTEREKTQLAVETGLMINQISNWFINARRRILQPLLEFENKQELMASSNRITEYDNDNHHFASNKNTDFHSDLASDAEYSQTNSDRNRSSSYYNHYADSHITGYGSKSTSKKASLSNVDYRMVNSNHLPNHHAAERVQQQSPPAWPSLPKRLPSIKILEKDLDAFYSD